MCVSEKYQAFFLVGVAQGQIEKTLKSFFALGRFQELTTNQVVNFYCQKYLINSNILVTEPIILLY